MNEKIKWLLFPKKMNKPTEEDYVVAKLKGELLHYFQVLNGSWVTMIDPDEMVFKMLQHRMETFEEWKNRQCAKESE